MPGSGAWRPERARPVPSSEPVGPRFIRGLARGLLALFYRRVDVVGAGRVPPRGPVIIAANHQNALVDPMLLLASIPRTLVPLAKAPLFRHPVIGPLIRLSGAIPVTRRQDVGGGSPGNELMFEAAAAALGRGEAILIFPEGVSQPEPTLMPLRTGAARMLLAAPPEVAAAISLLPVGLLFHEPERFRTGWALVLVGAPVETADCLRLFRTAPEDAVRRLTERLTAALRDLIAEVGDRQTLAPRRGGRGHLARREPRARRVTLRPAPNGAAGRRRPTDTFCRASPRASARCAESSSAT